METDDRREKEISIFHFFLGLHGALKKFVFKEAVICSPFSDKHTPTNKSLKTGVSVGVTE